MKRPSEAPKESTPLALALKEFFDKPLVQIPNVLRTRIEQDLDPLPWEDMTSDQRRRAAAHWDYLCEAGAPREHDDSFVLFAELFEIEQDIQDAELMVAEDALERAAQAQLVECLCRRRTKIEKTMA